MSELLVQEILGTQSGRPCLTCSFQAEDMVVLHMLWRRRPDIPVLFLDTGYHFAETYAYRDQIARQWQLNLINVQPAQRREANEAGYGKLYQTHPDQCCDLRKVVPLLSALEEYEIWFTGLRREQSPTRASLESVEPHTLPGGKSLVKVSPLAFWSIKEVWNYLHANGIAYHPLYDEGYLSIGCKQCTSVPLDPANPRSGRWAGRKQECGIHTFDNGSKAP
jgi:phosphoadenosine phosphosulfate reductase